jgi:hypothetical protein
VGNCATRASTRPPRDEECRSANYFPFFNLHYRVFTQDNGSLLVNAAPRGGPIGSCELDQQREFTKWVQRAEVLWDMGANVGFRTLLAAGLVSEIGKG